MKEKKWNKIAKSVFIWRWQPKVQQLIEQLTDKLSNRTTTVKTSTVTQPKEFNLTVPRPRAIPIPLPIPVLEKRPPVSFFMLWEILSFMYACVRSHSRGVNSLFKNNYRKTTTFDSWTRIFVIFCVIEGQISKKHSKQFFSFQWTLCKQIVSQTKEREKFGSCSCFVTFGARNIQWVQIDDSIDTSVSGSPWICKMFALDNALQDVRKEHSNENFLWT